MKLVMKVSCDDEWVESPSHAVIEITQERAKELQKLCDKVYFLGKEFEGIYCLEQFDYACRYFRIDDATDKRLLKACERADKKSPAILPDNVDLEPLQTESTDVEVVEVTADSIQWSCYIKHTTTRIQTETISRASFDKLFAQRERKRAETKA